MKVVLLAHVKGLGQKGDVKEVNSGYFHNFLKVKSLAKEGDSSTIKHVQTQKAKSVEKLEAILESAKAVKSLLEGKTVAIEEKVSESGSLYASVSTKEITEALKSQLRVIIPEKNLIVPAHIKSTGEYKLQAKLHKDITANFTLNVIAK